MSFPAIIPTAKVREALSSSSSVQDAAKSLGVRQDVLRAVALRYHLGGLFNACRDRGKASSGKQKQQRFNFVDMEGTVLRHGVVGARAPDVGANPRFRVTFSPCGHVVPVSGTRIRQDEARGQGLLCPTCRDLAKEEGRARAGGTR